MNIKITKNEQFCEENYVAYEITINGRYEGYLSVSKIEKISQELKQTKEYQNVQAVIKCHSWHTLNPTQILSKKPVDINDQKLHAKLAMKLIKTQAKQIVKECTREQKRTSEKIEKYQKLIRLCN